MCLMCIIFFFLLVLSVFSNTVIKEPILETERYRDGGSQKGLRNGLP